MVRFTLISLISHLDFQDVIHVGEKVQLKEEAPASVPGGKYDLNLVARNEKAKVTRKSQRILGLKSITLFSN